MRILHAAIMGAALALPLGLAGFSAPAHAQNWNGNYGDNGQYQHGYSRDQGWNGPFQWGHGIGDNAQQRYQIERQHAREVWQHQQWMADHRAAENGYNNGRRYDQSYNYDRGYYDNGYGR